MFITSIFILGLFFGSFANVCIFRWPRNGSIVKPPRSYCPQCKQSVAWYDNIPVLSFLHLRGQCRYCQSSISIQYPLVELLMGLAWVWAAMLVRQQGSNPSTGFFLLILSFFFFVIVTTLTDLEWKIIPDQASLSLLVIGVVLSVKNPILHPTSGTVRILHSFIGLVCGGGLIWMIAYFGELIFHKEAMGGGDIKLMAAIGAILGWKGTLATLFLASLLGAFTALLLLAFGWIKRRDYIPFGPFINMAALTVLILELSYPQWLSKAW